MTHQSASMYIASVAGQSRDLSLAIAREAGPVLAHLAAGATAAVGTTAWAEAVVSGTLAMISGEEGALERAAEPFFELLRRGASHDEVLRSLAISRRRFLRSADAALHDAADRFDALDRLLDAFDVLTQTIGRFHRHAEAAARHRDGEARFVGLVNAIGTVVIIISEDHRILAWNPQAERVYGWSSEEVLGRDYLQTFLPEEARPTVAADMRKVLEGELTESFENRIVARDGTQRILRWHVGRLNDTEGRPVAIVASGYDVTEQTRNREQLERNEAELQAILDNSPLVLFVKDLEGHFTRTNRLFDEFFERERGFAIGKKDADFLPPEVAASNRANDLASLESDKPLEFEEHIPGEDGVHVYWASKFVLRDAEGKPYAFCGIASDITARRRAEEERAMFQTRIIEAQRETLRELSTPLLPIAAGVVLMPLVGAIDAERAALVLEALLDGVSTHRAKTAILDITGVRTVDAEVAAGLVRAAFAARMLGARVVLTGVRPNAAQTLVTLGIDMRGIETVSSLQQGVAHAIARLGTRAAFDF